ncbi:MAG: hypothetical protein ACFFDF_05920 [Candidatus Odinarchaeota archaeon]
MNNIINHSKDIKTVLENKFDKFYKRLLKKKLVRICIYIEFIIFYPGLILAIIIANKSNPQGFNLISNYISDLGSVNFTTAPYIYNFIAILTGIITIPIFLYLEEYISTSKSKRNKINLSPNLTKLLARLGKIIFLIGSFGLFGVGIFSEDFLIFAIHVLFAVMAFGGFMVGGIITGFLIIVQKTIFPKIIGYYMAIYSLGLIILRFFHFIPIITLPLIEWIWFLGILIWLLPLTLFLLKHLYNSNKNQNNENS